MIILALIFGLGTALANLLGSLLAITRLRHGMPNIRNSVGFGGGFLLAAAFLEVLPESLEGGAVMPIYVIAGYLVVYLFEQLFATHVHENSHGGILPATTDEGPIADHTIVQELQHTNAVISPHAGLAALVGFNVHDFLDGLAIGAAMLTSNTLGIVVFLAVLLHEAPAGFTIASIILGAGHSRRAAVLAGGSIGITTLIGIMVPFAIGELAESTAQIFLALSAGSFIYIAATNLIPAANAGGAGKSRTAFLYVVLGMLVLFATTKGIDYFLR